jgi:ATP-dependent Clp protease ATP-binding subunit ClpA
MFERFTGRARHVVVLSQEEARLLNHNYIGTEHLLLGLLGEPESIAGQVLAGFGFTIDTVREEVADKVGRGKKAQSGHIPFTPRAKKTLELSLREALAIKHNYIGTEHILLGLIREGQGVAAQIMSERADMMGIRAAVLEAVSATGSSEAVEAEEGAEGEETNAVLRWLRQRLTRHAASVPFQPELHSAITHPARGTPAVEAALQQAARLAGPLPVGSHHLLLAALEDPNSAASWALASLGVDLDELRGKLRAARLAGTTDEQPEQAGRRQMAINVSDEVLTVVFTDPVIVQAGKEALRTLNARKVAAEKAAAEAGAAAGRAAAERSAAMAERSAAIAELAAAGKLEADADYIQSQLDTATNADPAALADAADAAARAGNRAASATETPAAAAAGSGSETASVTSTVIRGDHPAAANLANVWLELRKTLAFLADTTPPARRASRTIRATSNLKFSAKRTSEADPAEEAADPDEGEETA